MSKWTIYPADLAASTQSSMNQIMPYSCLRRIEKGEGRKRSRHEAGWSSLWFLPVPLSHISLSYFSYLQSLNTLVTVMLEVRKEMVCATQMVHSGKRDSTFLHSCVKEQRGCSLWWSVGHSEDTWTVCSAAAWEGCKHFFNRRESLWFFAAGRPQWASCQEGCWCSCSPRHAGEWTRWPLEGFFWDEMIQHPYADSSPSQLHLRLSDEGFEMGSGSLHRPLLSLPKSSSSDIISHRSDGHERGERPFAQIVALVTDNDASHKKASQICKCLWTVLSVPLPLKARCCRSQGPLTQRTKITD